MVWLFYLILISKQFLLVWLLVTLIIVLLPVRLKEASMLWWCRLLKGHECFLSFLLILLGSRSDFFLGLVLIADGLWCYIYRCRLLFNLAHILAYIFPKSLPIVQEILINFICSGSSDASLAARHVWPVIVHWCPIVDILQIVIWVIAAISLAADHVPSVRPAQVCKVVLRLLRITTTLHHIRRLIPIRSTQYRTRLVVPSKVTKWIVLMPTAFIMTQQRIVVLEHIGFIWTSVLDCV